MGQTKLGVYLANAHDNSWDYIRDLNPIGIRVLDPSTSVLKRLHEMLPNATLYPRFWSISENQAEYQANPVGHANQHVQFWKEKVAEFEQNGIPRDKIVVVGTNEPKVWSDISRDNDYNSWLADMKRVYKYNLDYNIAIANGLGQVNIKATLLNLSVGWPTNLKHGEPPDWSWSEPLVSPTLKYGHIWCVHEYFSKNSIQQNWGWWCGRWAKIPYDVPIVIGEVGCDQRVEDGQVPQHQRGWQGVYSPEQYAIELNSYAAHLELDKRVIVCFPFTTDYASRDWASFDTNPAAKEIVRESKIEYSTYLPVVVRTDGIVIGNPPEQPEPEVPQSEVVYRLKFPPIAPITGYFNSAHSGLDVGIPRTPLYAMYDGDVAWSDVDNPAEYNGGYGQYIRIYHPALKVHSFYAHLSERLVQQGQKVKTGQLIGYSGNSGNSSNFHLHFEIRLANDDGSYRKGVSKFKNSQVDPLAYLYALGNIFGHD